MLVHHMLEHAAFEFYLWDFIQIQCVSMDLPFFSGTTHLSHQMFCTQALSHTNVELNNSDERTKADVSR